MSLTRLVAVSAVALVAACTTAARNPFKSPVAPTPPPSSALSGVPSTSDPPAASAAGTAPPSAAPLHAAWAGLTRCPAGDGDWHDAVVDAAAERALDTLLADVPALEQRCPRHWGPRWLRGMVHLRQSRLPESIAALQGALELAVAEGQRAGEMRSARQLAFAIGRAGLDAARAVPLYERALQIAREDRREDQVAFIAMDLGSLAREDGRYYAATRYYADARAAMEHLGLERSLFGVTFEQAVLRFLLGDVHGSRRGLEATVEGALTGGRAWYADVARVPLGHNYLATADLDRAEACFAAVGGEDPEPRLKAQFGLALVALARGALPDAIARLRAAAEQAHAAGLRDALFADAWLGHALDRAGRREEARALLRRTIERADADLTADTSWTARWWLGRSLRLGDEPGPAREVLREALRRIEAGSRDLARDEGLRFLRGRTGPYVELALALAAPAAGDGATATEVFDVVERAHARTLRAVLLEQGTLPEVRSLGTVQAGLAEGDLLLDYLFDRDGGVLLAITRTGFSAHELSGLDALAPRLARYRKGLQRPLTAPSWAMESVAKDYARYRTDGEALADALLGPVRADLARAKRLLVVPDGDLALLPFAALPVGPVAAGGDAGSGGSSAPGDAAWPEFLGARLPIAMLPMAGSPSAWARGDAPVLVAGDPLPDHDGEFPPLPHARAEIDRITATWGDASRRLTAAELGRAQLDAANLGRFALLHLATHAVASSVDPTQCGVVLSNGERLGLDDIARARLGPALVVLSACRTGEGEVVPGEGVVGLSWGFLRAGAIGLVSSLWPVDDASTATLMAAFHEHLKAGVPPDDALARARRTVAATHPHPAFWAPFVVTLRPAGAR